VVRELVLIKVRPTRKPLEIMRSAILPGKIVHVAHDQ